MRTCFTYSRPLYHYPAETILTEFILQKLEQKSYSRKLIVTGRCCCAKLYAKWCILMHIKRVL